MAKKRSRAVVNFRMKMQVLGCPKWILIHHRIQHHDHVCEKELNGDHKIDKKNVCGASKLRLVAGQQMPIELERNEFGQPVGDDSVDLSTFLGCLTREFMSDAVEKWDDVSKDVRNKLWSCLKMKYKFEEWDKKPVLQKLNKLWRDGKSKVQISIGEANIGPLGSRRLGLLPETMSNDD